MFEKTLVHEFLISYSHTKWYFLFPTVQLQVHNENPARHGRNTDVLVNLNTKLTNYCRGRVDDLSFFYYLSIFCFLLIEFHHSFSISYKMLQYYVYYYILTRMWYAVGTYFFRARFASFHTLPLFLLSSSVSLSYFGLAVPLRECLGKNSCMSSTCPIAILNGTFLFFARWTSLFELKLRLSKSN